MLNQALMNKQKEEYGERMVEIDVSELTIQPIQTLFGLRLCICYKDVPLWNSSETTLEGVAVFLYVPTDTEREEDNETCTLFCVDANFEDIYTYGMWSTREQAEQWLANPTKLY